MKAYILVQASVGSPTSVAEAIGELPAVKSVHNVTGPYDVVVEVEARNADHLSTAVIPTLHEVEGVTRTLPCIRPKR